MALPLAYRALTMLAAPAVRLLLARRAGRGKEDPARMGERLGRPGVARPAGPLVWLHGASVGEALSILPLVARLGGRGLSVLVTTGTVTSAQLMAERLPAGAIHQFVPVDLPGAVARFLDHWRPDAAIWVESELWPNLVLGAAARGVPMALVNARMSEESRRGWSRAPGLARALIGAFSTVQAQSAEDAERFASLGARDVGVPGNLKAAAEPLAADDAALSALAAALGDRPRWLAASTHAGEERIAAAVHRALAPKHPGLLTMIVPRHPARGGEIAAETAALGLSVARRSAGAAPGPETDVYVADTLGELGLFYRLAPLSFVGNSLSAGGGGHNPLEPARLGATILSGPRVHNFADAFAALAAADALVETADEDALAAALDRLLSDPAEARRRAEAAGRVAAADSDVTDRVIAALDPLLAPLSAPEGRGHAAA